MCEIRNTIIDRNWNLLTDRDFRLLKNTSENFEHANLRKQVLFLILAFAETTKCILYVSNLDTVRYGAGMQSLLDLNLRELQLFLLASRAKSLREVSRRSGLQPAHVSKIMQKLEEKLGFPLFLRTTAGVTLTDSGRALVKPVEQIMESSEQLTQTGSRISSHEKLWTIGSISFIATYFLAPLVGPWSQQLRETRFRLIEFTHNEMVAYGLQGAFEMAVHVGRSEWTHTWETILLGKMQWKLYGRRGHRLGDECTEEDLRELPFIVPTDWHAHGYAVGNDFCPYPVSLRKKGDEASTAETALQLCQNSDQLTFVPEILARSFVEQGRVQEINVTDWDSVEKEIYLTVKALVVPQKLVKMITTSAHKFIA